MQNRIYLDNAATTPLDPEVLDAMIPVMRDLFGNPSSTHGHGRKAKALMEEARGSIAKLLNCQPSEIFFTSGGTEADNLALRSTVMYKGIKNIITSPIEHHAVLLTAEELQKAGQAEMHLVKLLADGHVNLNHLQELLNTLQNSMVSLMHANNEIGNMLDVEAVGQMAHNAGALFHCDTVQTMGHFPFDLSKGHIDYLAAAAHKFNGPKGVGFIYMNKSHRLPPQITGGTQEREVRGGTENVYGIIGMAKALEICYRDMEKKRSHIEGLKNRMIELLKNEIPGVAFNGDCKGHCLFTVLSVSFPASETGNMLLFNLDIAGISASGGSACSSGNNTSSHVIRAINPGTDRSTVRFSFGKFNTEEEIAATVEKLKTWYPAAVQA